MKLFATLFATFCLAASAFGVTSSTVSSVQKSVTKNPALVSSLRKGTAVSSPLFRNPLVTRGGAVPGWDAYTKALDKNPLTAKAFTSLVGWALGDALAQVLLVKGPFDWTRWISFSAFGFLYHGPSGHFFYNWLDSKIEGTDAKSVFLKVAIDQLFWCPIFMTVFFTYLGVVRGDSLSVIAEKIKADLFEACKTSWKTWPIIHAINFKLVPSKYRLFYINTVQIAFNIFLSIIGSKK